MVWLIASDTCDCTSLGSAASNCFKIASDFLRRTSASSRAFCAVRMFAIFSCAMAASRNSIALSGFSSASSARMRCDFAITLRRRRSLACIFIDSCDPFVNETEETTGVEVFPGSRDGAQ